MNAEKNTPRILGVAFLFVLIASALSSILLNSATGSGSMPEILMNISKNITLFRLSIIVELVTSIGIVVLSVLLYSVLRVQNKVIALVALGWWLAEAITLAISKIGAFSLIHLSQEYVHSGTAKPSYYNTMGDFLFNGFDRTGYGIHFLFYCLGGVLWFYLFYKSNYIPKTLAVWGVLAESLSLIGSVIVLCDIRVNVLYFAHIAILELVMGLWLIVKGIRNYSETVTPV